MKDIPGVDHEKLERLYLLASAKAQICAAHDLLKQALDNLTIARVHAPMMVAIRRALRESSETQVQMFEELEDAP